MNNKKLNKIANIFCPLLSILAVALLWQLLYVTVDSNYIFPSLWQTLVEVWLCFCDGNFWIALANTFGRVLLCFAVSFLLAFSLGVLSYLYAPVKRTLAPIVAIFRSAPTVAMMVILTLLVKSTLAPVIVGLLVLLPMLYATVLSALAQVDEELLQMCKIYQVPTAKRIRYLYLPTLLPYLLGELGATLSFAVKLVISAEILSYTYQSVGGLIQGANVYLDMPLLFALTAISVVVSTLLEWGFNLVVKCAFKECDK